MRASLFIAVLGLLVAACAGSAPDGPDVDAPEDALRTLEARLNEADYVSFRATLLQLPPQEDWVTQLETQVWLGPDGAARIESLGQVNGLGAAPGLVADGETVLGGRNGFASRFTDFDEPAAATLRDWFVAGFARRGLVYPLLHFVTGVAPDVPLMTDGPGDPGARLTPVDPSWGVPEAIDGRNARPLTFSLPLDGVRDVAVTLWIDTETGLPLKRTQRVAGESGATTTDESYTDWSFASLSDTLFVRPE